MVDYKNDKFERLGALKKRWMSYLVQKSVQVQTHAKMTIHVTSFVTKQF
jgi:hypothetical protein